LNLTHYFHYKASGVEWINEKIPSHWTVQRLKYVLRPGGYKAGPFGSSLITSALKNVGRVVVLTPEHVANGTLTSSSDLFLPPQREEEMNAFRVQNGDVVLPIVGSLGRALVIPQGVEGIINQRLAKMSPDMNAILPEYLALILRSFEYFKILDEVDSKGAILTHITKEKLLNRELPLPPVTEQRSILSFLQVELGNVDSLIAEQQRLIELLNEKRQAIISHAVTKGLNPNAPIKPSDVEWLGDIPSHWKVGALKRFCSSLDGRRIPMSTEERSGRRGDYPYYGASGIIDYVDDFIFDEELVLVSEDGANLLNRSTPIAFVASGKYWVNNHAHILRPPDENAVYWASRIEAIDLMPFVTGSAQPKFTSEALNSLVIAVPPTAEERRAIQQHISVESAKLDALAAEAVRAIALLQERRTALISAAVTGHIDVRTVAELQPA
jgi:type I restriction enzyme, S subunit